MEQNASCEHLYDVPHKNKRIYFKPVNSQISLVSRLRNGDRTAAQELVDCYYQRIYLYLRELGHSRHTSEDLTQEAFIRAWYHISQLRNEKALSTWLFRIASRLSKGYWQKNWHKDGHDYEQLSLEENYQRETPYTQADQQEQYDRLSKALLKLTWKKRQAIVLHYIQQFTIADAAHVAGVKEGTFKSRLNRALKTLRLEVNNERT